MRHSTDESCGTCGARIVYCDECERSFCPHEMDHDCAHDYEDDPIVGTV